MTVDNHAIPMSDHDMSMVNRGMAMDHHGAPRVTMALPWVTMDDHGYPRHFHQDGAMGHPLRVPRNMSRITMACHGSPWQIPKAIRMALHDPWPIQDPWSLTMATHGITMACHGTCHGIAMDGPSRCHGIATCHCYGSPWACHMARTVACYGMSNLIT